jgi:hypothetical protein
MVDYQIREGFESYDDLEETDQELIASECIKLLGNDAYDFIVEPDNFSKAISHFQKFIATGSQLEGYDFLSILRENAIHHYAPIMNELFMERSEWRKSA